ncbi:tetratricopeptide repeat protein 37-like [Tubulanus polymorphus]|uniref:tetratricopeptide repeat protein 37-like n=1 Tax=Tubulanus polymorphus TaxID=672921 RepID=UPI003DA22436
METKEIKSLLKNAREAIKMKNFKEALKHCKTVLKDDKNNYNALVFVGVAAEGLEQPEQALTAYKRATDSNPDQTLAWQGLSAFYEKHYITDYYADLVTTYGKLTKLFENDSKKKREFSKKLAMLHELEGSIDGAVAVYQLLLSSDETEEKFEIQNNIIRLLETRSSELSNNDLIVLYKAYKEVLYSDGSPGDGGPGSEEAAGQEMWVKFIRLIIKMNLQPEEIEIQCKRCILIYPQLSYPLEKLALIMLSRCLNACTLSGDLIDVLGKLKANDPESYAVDLIGGCDYYFKRNFTAAIDLLNRVVEKKSLVLLSRLFQSRAYCAMHDFDAVDKSVKSGLKLAQKSNCVHLGCDVTRVVNELNLCLVRGLLDDGTSHSIDAAVRILETLPETIADVEILKAFCQYYRGDIEQCIARMNDLNVADPTSKALCLSLNGCCHFHNQNLDEALNCFREALSIEPSNGVFSYWVGRVLLELAKSGSVDKNEALSSLIKSVKLDPNYSDSYYYLGEFYAHFENNKEKVKKCFLKSYALKPTSDRVGEALVDILIELGEEDKTVDILESVTSKASAGCAKWAWLRLGLHQLQVDDPSSALASLQCALRSDPDDYHVWECLGEVYVSRGSYNAAMKAFQRANQLQSDSVYSLYKIASIKESLGVYREAQNDYESLLSKSPDYIPALKGLAETHLQIARRSLNQFFHGRAVDHCQSAIGILVQAASMRPDLSSLWKCLGDACTIINPVPSEICKMAIPRKLLKQSSEIGEVSPVSKYELLVVGGRCYGQALKILPDCSNLWHDLGVSYHYQSLASPRDQTSQLSNKAMQSLQKAVCLSSTNYKHWLTLGVITMSNNPSLAQHCFIKSIEFEQNNVEAWTNLGALYLKRDNIDLAHRAFKKAQSLEPSYVDSWIGQSIIAERVSHEDAMDLFRHTTALDNHIEGFIGYGHWVCKALLGVVKLPSDLYRYCVDQMYAISVASDALVKYNDRIRNDRVALNLAGLLLERQNLLKSASEVLNVALTTGDCSLIRANYARVLYKLGKISESISQWELIEPLSELGDICYYALACYHAGDYERSLLSFTNAVEVANTDIDKSHLFAAIGKISFILGDPDSAKTALFRSTQSESASVFGLESLCYLALLQSDVTLAMAVLQELEKFLDGPSSSSRRTQSVLCHLISRFYSLAGDKSKAIEEMTRLAQSFSNNAELWSILADYTLNCPPEGDPERAIAYANKAYELDHRYNASRIIAEALIQTGNDEAFKATQKLLHIYPHDKNNWELFRKALSARS